VSLFDDIRPDAVLGSVPQRVERVAGWVATTRRDRERLELLNRRLDLPDRKGDFVLEFPEHGFEADNRG